MELRKPYESHHVSTKLMVVGSIVERTPRYPPLQFLLQQSLKPSFAAKLKLAETTPVLVEVGKNSRNVAVSFEAQ